MKAFYETRKYDSPLKIWHKVYNDLYFVPHWHSEVEFIYVRDGIAEIYVEDSMIFAKKGDLVICDSGKVHYSNSNYMENSLEFLIFDPKLIHQLFYGFFLKKPHLKKENLIELDIEKELIALFNLIAKELYYKNKYYDEIAVASVKKFCFFLLRKVQHLPKSKNNANSIEKTYNFNELINFIENNFESNITLKKGAKIMGLSDSYFSTLFKEYTGYNFTKYINLIRIEKSLNALKNKDKNIIEIAFNLGFNNVRSFNREFKNFTGITPTEFYKNSNAYLNSIPFNIRKDSFRQRTKDFNNKTLVSKHQFQ